MEPDLCFAIIGAWTVAKVSFLAYDLRTRYPHAEIAVCSALVASSSRERHVLALDLLDRIIGVRILHSVGAFASFVVPNASLPDELPSRKSFLNTVAMAGCDGLNPVDRELIAWLFRGCTCIEAKVLRGYRPRVHQVPVCLHDERATRRCGPHIWIMAFRPWVEDGPVMEMAYQEWLERLRTRLCAWKRCSRQIKRLSHVQGAAATGKPQRALIRKD